MSGGRLNADTDLYGRAAAENGAPPTITSDHLVAGLTPVEQLLRVLGLAANADDSGDTADSIATQAERDIQMIADAEAFAAEDRQASAAMTGVGGPDQMAQMTQMAQQIPQLISGIAGAITGSGTLTKLAAGNLTLSGANMFAGATLVSAGTLTASSGSLAGTSGITVNGAVLSAVNYNAAATLALDAAATATVSGSALTITGAVTNAGTNADALNFSASTGKITLTSLAGAGKTRFGAAADITGGSRNALYDAALALKREAP